MPEDRKIGRQFIRSRTTRVFTAKSPCLVHIWCGDYVDSNDIPATDVFWELEKDKCSLAEGVPLPLATTIPVALAKGESIWAVTEDVALVGWSVVEDL